MKKFIANIFGAFLLLTTPAVAQDVCYTPSQFVENITELAEKENAEIEILHYTVSDVEAIREWVKKKLPEGAEIIDFDTDIIIIRDGYPVALNMIFKDGCKVGFGTITLEAIAEIKDVLKGV